MNSPQHQSLPLDVHVLIYKTSCGSLRIESAKNGVRKISWTSAGPIGHDGRFLYPFEQRLCKKLNRYFSGLQVSFSDIPLIMEGTEYEKKVWRVLKKIPYGVLKSYEDIARAIRSPGSARAIGNACNKNPLPVIVPCHRVIRKNGCIGGYALGTAKKIFLINLERKNAVRHNKSLGNPACYFVKK